MNAQPPSTSALDEEIARAEVYGLLSQLYYTAPTPELLSQLRVAATEAPSQGGYLESSWRDLVHAARSMSDGAIAAEFDALFGGVGKPEVYLYGSHYLTGFLNEKPVAKLRTDLAALGLGKSEAMSDTEDHMAYGFEVMRYLIAGDDVSVSNLAQQQKFFAAHLQPWLTRACEAVAAHPSSQFYKAAAQFTLAFAEVETQAFDLLGE